MGASTATDRSGDPSGIRAVRRALGYLRSYKPAAFGAFGALLCVTGANLVTPLLIARAIDDGIRPGNLNVLFIIVGGLVGVALTRGLFTFLQGYLAERASQGVAYDLRNALFERIGRLSFSYYDRVQTGQLVTRLTNDVEQIRTFTGSGIVQLGNAAVMLIGTTFLLFYLNWRLALVALAIIPPIIFVLVRFVREDTASLRTGPADARAPQHRLAGRPLGGARDPGFRPRGLRDRTLPERERRTAEQEPPDR